MSYKVFDYHSGKLLSGKPSKSLIKESFAEPTGTGAVKAWYNVQDDTWHYVSNGEESLFEKTRTVYVL